MMQPALTSNIIEELKYALVSLNIKRVSPIKYGWHQKSVGCKVVTENGSESWIRVQSRPSEQLPSKLWTGLEEAQKIPIDNKPSLFNEIEWSSNERIYKAELMSYINLDVISPTPELKKTIALSEKWLQDLETSLNTINSCTTNRICVRQDLINRRLAERYNGSVSSMVECWTTAHGDIHWANITHPTLYILDWEAWGLAPKGLDIANLYCFSLLNQNVAEVIHYNFNHLLDTPDGIISQLFVCAERMRMTEIYGDHKELYKCLDKHSKNLLKNNSHYG